MKHTSKLVLGAANFGSSVSESEALNIIDYAFSHGINAIDTADSYGLSEEIIGKSLKGRRDKFILVTKVGNPTSIGSGLSQEHINKSLRNSLQILQTDYVDLYMAHNWDKRVPILESISAFNYAVESGLARALGCSNFTLNQILESLELSKRLEIISYSNIQPVYNIIERGAESDLLPFASANNLSVWTYSPLAGGVLSGKYLKGIPVNSRAENFPNANPREAGFVPKITKETINISAKVSEIAHDYCVTSSQLALAWTLANQNVTSVIVGVRNLGHLKEILNLNVPKEALRELADSSMKYNA